jgi:hypothetical protein
VPAILLGSTTIVSIAVATHWRIRIAVGGINAPQDLCLESGVPVQFGEAAEWAGPSVGTVTKLEARARSAP